MPKKGRKNILRLNHSSLQKHNIVLNNRIQYMEGSVYCHEHWVVLKVNIE